MKNERLRGYIRWARSTISCSSSRIQNRKCYSSTPTHFATAAALAGGASGLKALFTLGRADYGVNLLAAVEAAGSISPRCLAGPDDVAMLNYTGGTTRKSKGALRHHRQLTPFAGLILADFELPERPSFLAVAPISHVAGSKVVPTLMRGGTVHMLKGFDPDAVLATIAREKINLATIAREKINFTLFVPTMIYVLLDHPALRKTDLSSLELLLYGASPMAPSRLLEAIERIGPPSSTAKPSAIRFRLMS